jgi:hypothetical protein
MSHVPWPFFAEMALARTPGEARFAFGVEWLDPHAGMYRNLNMMYYESDGSVELYDVKARRNFLKRCAPAESFTARDCTIGATVTVRALPSRRTAAWNSEIFFSRRVLMLLCLAVLAPPRRCLRAS